MAVALALAGVALMLYVGWHGTPLPGDLWATHQVQGWGQLERNAGIINGAAWALRFVVAGAVLLVLLGRRIGLRPRAIPSQREAMAALAAAVVFAIGDNLLKAIAESPRPSAAFGVRIDSIVSGYGFPSGHVYSDTLFYGLIAVIAPAWLPSRLIWPARVVCLAIIVLAGPARIVVGAHWPSDTVGGYLFGGAALCAVLWFGRWVVDRR